MLMVRLDDLPNIKMFPRYYFDLLLLGGLLSRLLVRWSICVLVALFGVWIACLWFECCLVCFRCFVGVYSVLLL